MEVHSEEVHLVLLLPDRCHSEKFAYRLNRLVLHNLGYRQCDVEILEVLRVLHPQDLSLSPQAW